MERVDLLILACSRRPGGRCLAGVDTATNEWIRPISSVADGALQLHHWPPVGEIWSVPLLERHPQPWQPENYLIGDEPRNPVSRPVPAELLERLEPLVSDNPALFGTYGSTVSQEECEQQPRQSSLCLVEPSEIHWQVTQNYRGERQIRALFTLEEVFYDLPVTDMDWEKRFRGVEEGIYDEAPEASHGRSFFTISLGEPYKGSCFKLLAAVITF